MPENHLLQPGDTVKVIIDWSPCYKLMRLHFAAEIVLEFIYLKIKNINKIGAHIAEDKARIDFEWPKNISSLLPELQNKAKQIIDSDQPVISAFSDELNEKRYWKIEHFHKYLVVARTSIALTKLEVYA